MMPAHPPMRHCTPRVSFRYICSRFQSDNRHTDRHLLVQLRAMLPRRQAQLGSRPQPIIGGAAASHIPIQRTACAPPHGPLFWSGAWHLRLPRRRCAGLALLLTAAPHPLVSGPGHVRTSASPLAEAQARTLLPSGASQASWAPSQPSDSFWGISILWYCHHQCYGRSFMLYIAIK